MPEHSQPASANEPCQGHCMAVILQLHQLKEGTLLPGQSWPLGNQGTHVTAWWHPQMLCAALLITPDYEVRLIKASEVVSTNQNQHFYTSFLQRCGSAFTPNPLQCAFTSKWCEVFTPEGRLVPPHSRQQPQQHQHVFAMRKCQSTGKWLRQPSSQL